jgi:hypothetical protein
VSAHLAFLAQRPAATACFVCRRREKLAEYLK